MTCSIVCSFACCRCVSRSGRFQSAQRAPFSQRAPSLVPGLAADDVERLCGERDDVEGVEAERRLRAALDDDARDPVAHVAGDELEPRAALPTEQVKEARDRLLVAAVGRPDQPARIVADDNMM